MTDKNLTDKEIIKAFELCLKCEDFTGCRECPAIDNGHNTIPKCRLALFNNALDLLTRQQSENKRLEKEVGLVSIQFQDLQERYEEAQAEIESLKIFRGYAGKRANDYKTMRDKYLNAKSEAYKECLAKVKNYIKTHCNPYGKPDFDYDTSIKILNFIDNLAKEITGE